MIIKRYSDGLIRMRMKKWVVQTFQAKQNVGNFLRSFVYCFIWNTSTVRHSKVAWFNRIQRVKKNFILPWISNSELISKNLDHGKYFVFQTNFLCKPLFLTSFKNHRFYNKISPKIMILAQNVKFWFYFYPNYRIMLTAKQDHA